MNKTFKTIVVTMNSTSGEIVSSNSSFIAATNLKAHADADSFISEGISEEEYWPDWIRQVTNISHLCLTINCSVNFYIYSIKSKALGPTKPSKQMNKVQ